MYQLNWIVVSIQWTHVYLLNHIKNSSERPHDHAFSMGWTRKKSGVKKLVEFNNRTLVHISGIHLHSLFTSCACLFHWKIQNTLTVQKRFTQASITFSSLFKWIKPLKWIINIWYGSPIKHSSHILDCIWCAWNHRQIKNANDRLLTCFAIHSDNVIRSKWKLSWNHK